MKHIVETGTDGAAVCFFDAAAMPEDFDGRVEGDPHGTFEDLRKKQMLWHVDTGGDGRHLFHVYVNEPFRPEVGCRAKEIANFEQFACPSGLLWICGAEYAAKDPMSGNASTPKGGLNHYAHMGGKVSLEKGHLRVKVHGLEWDDEAESKALAANLPKGLLWRSRLVESARIVSFMLGAIAIFFGGLLLIFCLIVTGYRWIVQSPQNKDNGQALLFFCLS